MENLMPLVDALQQTVVMDALQVKGSRGPDDHLVYTMRIAVRNHLRLEPSFATLRAARLKLLLGVRPAQCSCSAPWRWLAGLRPLCRPCRPRNFCCVIGSARWRKSRFINPSRTVCVNAVRRWRVKWPRGESVSPNDYWRLPGSRRIGLTFRCRNRPRTPWRLIDRPSAFASLQFAGAPVLFPLRPSRLSRSTGEPTEPRALGRCPHGPGAAHWVSAAARYGASDHLGVCCW